MAKGKDFKRPSAKSNGRFVVKEETIPSRHDDSLKPIFSFYHMRYGDTYCLSSCERTVQVSVADTLVRLSQLPWGRIISERKDGLGCETIPRYRFKVPLPSTITPEVPVIVFRHSESGRIAGFRDGNIYHVTLIGDDLYSH